jgi:hypothetical protein
MERFAKNASLKVTRINYNAAPSQFLVSLWYLLNNNLRKTPKYPEERGFIYSKFLFILLLPLSYICNWLSIGDQVELFLTK